MQGHTKSPGLLDLLDDKSSTAVEARGGEARKASILPNSRAPHIVFMIRGSVQRATIKHLTHAK